MACIKSLIKKYELMIFNDKNYQDNEYTINKELMKNTNINNNLIIDKEKNIRLLNGNISKNKLIKNKIIKNKNDYNKLIQNKKMNEKSIDSRLINDRLINTKIIQYKQIRHIIVNNKLSNRLIKYKLNIGEYYDIKKILKLGLKTYNEEDDEKTIDHLDYVIGLGLNIENKDKWISIPHIINNKIKPE